LLHQNVAFVTNYEPMNLSQKSRLTTFYQYSTWANCWFTAPCRRELLLCHVVVVFHFFHFLLFVNTNNGRFKAIYEKYSGKLWYYRGIFVGVPISVQLTIRYHWRGGWAESADFFLIIYAWLLLLSTAV